jgi:predicted Na+-dependent transporter
MANRVAGALLPLALAAVALALLVPSEETAARGDLLLAVLVVITALGIAPHELWDLRTCFTAVLALSLAPFLALVPLARALSRLFDSPVREGVLMLGLSSTEVAAVGLVALAGGDAALALGALAGSLIASATLGPLLIGVLAADAASTDTGALLRRFALVVLLPLAVGVAARAASPRLTRSEPWYAAGSTVAVAALVYAALSGTSAGHHLASALAASAAFLALSAIPALATARVVSPPRQSAVGLAVALRDFAVAATLATQATDTGRTRRRPHLNRLAASRATRPAIGHGYRMPCEAGVCRTAPSRPVRKRAGSAASVEVGDQILGAARDVIAGGGTSSRGRPAGSWRSQSM